MQIEDGIPIPEPKIGGASLETRLIRELAVGQSFLMPSGEKSFRKARNLAYYVGTKWKVGERRKKFTVRVVDDGIRIWRLT